MAGISFISSGSNSMLYFDSYLNIIHLQTKNNSGINNIPVIVSYGDSTNQVTSPIILASYTATKTGTFQINPYVNILSVVTNEISVNIDWTDESNNSRNFVYSTMSAIGFYTLTTRTIRAKTGTSILVGIASITSGGTINYDAGASIIQLY